METLRPVHDRWSAIISWTRWHLEIGVQHNHHARLKHLDQAAEEPAVACSRHTLSILSPRWPLFPFHICKCIWMRGDFQRLSKCTSQLLSASLGPGEGTDRKGGEKKQIFQQAGKTRLDRRNSIGQNSRRPNDSQSENSMWVNACGDRDQGRNWPLGVTLALEYL